MTFSDPPILYLGDLGVGWAINTFGLESSILLSRGQGGCTGHGFATSTKSI